MRKKNSRVLQPARPAALPLPPSGAAGGGTDAESLLQGLPWGVVVLDAQGTILRLNPQAAHWWGASPQVLQGQLLGPATAGTLPADLQQALRILLSGLPLPLGAFFLPQQQQWIAMSSVREADNWVVYWQDITAQKQAELQYHDRQAAAVSLLRRTEAVARIGSYEMELATGQFRFSDGLFRLLGEEPGAFAPELSLINARSHPDDVALVQQLLNQAIADRQPYCYQRRIYRPDGQLRTLEVHGRVECDAQGQPAKLLGLLQDVTEREQAAQELLRVKDELTQRATDNYTTLYNSMDEGFCILEVLFDAAQQPINYRYLDVNPAFEKQTGLREVIGKTIRELVPAVEPFWPDVYGQVARTGEPTRFESYFEALGRWFDVNAFAIGPAQPRHVAVLFTDISARKATEQALRQSEARYRALFTNMAQGFCLVEKVATAPGAPSDYRYLAVNPAFERHTGLADATGKTLRQLVPGVELRIIASYDEVVASGEARRFEEYVADLDAWIEAEVVPDAQPGHLSVLFSNVSVRRQAEQALRESEAQQAYLLALSDALRPVSEAVEIQATVTRTALHHFAADRCYYAEIAGDAVTIRHDAASPGLPSVVGVYSLSQMPLFSTVLRGAGPAVEADVEASPTVDDHLKQICRESHILAYLIVPVMRRSELVGTLCLGQATPRVWTVLEVALLQETAERTWAAVERAGTEEALRRSEEQFRSLVTATSDTVYRMGADWTQMEQLVGKSFLADTLGPTLAWVEAYIPAEDLPSVQATIAEAIRQKGPFELEHRVRRADGTVGWTYSRAVPMLGAQGELTGWLGTARDVSARKAFEVQLLEFNARLERQVAERTQSLAESQVRLQSVFDSTTTAVALLRAVRDAEGHLLDFEYALVNPVTQAYHAGQELIGQRYCDIHPGAQQPAAFRQLATVVETGRRADFELLDDRGGYNHWFRLVGVKLGDGLLYSAEDITARKLLEQAQTKSFALLQESEDIAGMGSWDYDLSTKELICSDGLYHLLDRAVGSAVGPQFFLNAVLDDDRPAAARLMRTLTAGTDRFDESLRLRVGAAVKTVRFKAVPLPHAPGAPVRVLGVCLDVSDMQRLEAENLALKLDRHKELLLAILQAQENERQRLGEVLHNSLGQVLYATKLHLDQFDTPALHALPALATLHQHTDRLLTEAMRQTRTLAHELVPTSLAKFGLARALGDVCRDLSTPQLRLESQVWGEEHALPQPVQATLFRLAQELAHNIVRHAGATQALLELETLPDWVSLRAEDNGRGFDPQIVDPGLGLRTVRDAVALLGGTVAIDSSPEFGTHIRLRIPLPLFS